MTVKPMIKHFVDDAYDEIDNDDEEEIGEEDEDEEINRLQLLLNEQNKLKYSSKCFIECVSPFKLDRHLFNHFSVLVQTISFERFDWTDTIIARNVDNSCFKIKLLNGNETSIRETSSEIEHKIRIELKCLNQENLDKLKSQIIKLIDELFCYYPGLYFYKRYINA